MTRSAITPIGRFPERGHPPPDLPEVDLEALPSLYKRYPRTGKIALDPGGSLGRLLRQSNGVTRIRWVSGVDRFGVQRPATAAVSPRWLVPGRPVPSAGGRYPIEVYLATGATPEAPSGLYHYDPAHHALDRLCGGDGRALIGACLAQPPVDPPELVLVLTTVFWRNSAKYGRFGYRLQTLDAGVVVAQVLAAGRSAGYSAGVHLRFADQRLDDLRSGAPEPARRWSQRGFWVGWPRSPM